MADHAPDSELKASPPSPTAQEPPPSSSSSPPPAPRPAFACATFPMPSSKKSAAAARNFHSLDSSSSSSGSSRRGRRSRLFALFGPGVEESGERQQQQQQQSQRRLPQTPASRGSAAVAVSLRNSTSNRASSEQFLLQPGAPTHSTRIGEFTNMTYSSDSAGVAKTSPDSHSNNDAANDEENENSSNGNSRDVTPGQQNQTRSARLSTRQHKRPGSGFTIINKQSADAVLLPSSIYTPSAQASHETRANKESATASAATGTATAPKTQQNEPPKAPSTFNQRPVEQQTTLLPSTSFGKPGPSHGVLKTPGDDKKPSDKRVRFVAAAPPSVKDDDGDDDNDDGAESDDSDKTIKAGVGGMKALVHPSLSPVIWDKGSEPKIWLKEGKPTLFQPTKEPGYYTCPLWSRQYPEILSDDPNVNPYAGDYAASVDNNNSNNQPSTSTVNNMNMAASPMTPQKSTFNKTPRSTIRSPPPPPPSQSSLVIPPTPPGFNYPPRYRNRVVLEVGGRRFVSSLDVLERSPYFKHFFSVPFLEWYRDGTLHIDNDPDLFAHILRYLRTASYPLFWDARNGFDYTMYAMILQQARYYLLPKLEAWISEQKYLDVVEIEVLHRKTQVFPTQEWVSEQKLEANDSYEVSGAAFSGKICGIRQGEETKESKGHDSEDCQGRISGSVSQERMETESVQLFTTSKKLKVNVELLRAEAELYTF